MYIIQGDNPIMTRTPPEQQLNMENFKITERGGHHKPNSQRYPDNCGCEESTRGGYAYRDKVAESTNTKETEWDKIRFYHQAPVVKKNSEIVRVNTYGHGLNPTTRERINKELPRDYKIRQKDYEVKLEVPNGDLIEIPQKFDIQVIDNTIRETNGDLICSLQVATT